MSPVRCRLQQLYLLYHAHKLAFTTDHLPPQYFDRTVQSWSHHPFLIFSLSDIAGYTAQARSCLQQSPVAIVVGLHRQCLRIFATTRRAVFVAAEASG